MNKEIEIVEFKDYTQGTLDDYYEKQATKEFNKNEPVYTTNRQGILNLLSYTYKSAYLDESKITEEVAIDNHLIKDGIYAVAPNNINLFTKISKDEQEKYNEKSVPYLPGKVCI